MVLVDIDTNDEELLEKPVFELLEPGVYDFEIGNKPCKNYLWCNYQFT